MSNPIQGASLAKKKLAAMKAVEAVVKRGRNEKQGYGYVKASDVANEVRGALIDNGLAFSYTVNSCTRWERATQTGGSMYFSEVFIGITLTDIDTGETETISSVGWGSDMTDKAPYKAMTGALKYGLRMAFLIPDESDPEHEPAKPSLPAFSTSPQTPRSPSAPKPQPQQAQAGPSPQPAQPAAPPAKRPYTKKASPLSTEGIKDSGKQKTLPVGITQADVDNVESGLRGEPIDPKIEEVEKQKFDDDAPLDVKRNEAIQAQLRTWVGDNPQARRKMVAYLERVHNGKSGVIVGTKRWEQTFSALTEAFNTSPEAVEKLYKEGK